MNKNVHTEHCCNMYGCKYRDDDCPVALGIQKQSFECEDCESDKEDAKQYTKYYFSLLTDDERMDIISSCCKYCGTLKTVNPNCQCWNDE